MRDGWKMKMGFAMSADGKVKSNICIPSICTVEEYNVTILGYAMIGLFLVIVEED